VGDEAARESEQGRCDEQAAAAGELDPRRALPGLADRHVHEEPAGLGDDAGQEHRARAQPPYSTLTSDTMTMTGNTCVGSTTALLYLG
jgi:hypothetical protein